MVAFDIQLTFSQSLLGRSYNAEVRTQCAANLQVLSLNPAHCLYWWDVVLCPLSMTTMEPKQRNCLNLLEYSDGEVSINSQQHGHS